MQETISHFQANIERVRNLGYLHQSLKTQVTSVLDLSDILRAQLVMAVSALDYFVHEIVELGMLEIYAGKRPQTKKYSEFPIPLMHLQNAKTTTSYDWLKNEIRNVNSYQSFQKPDKIAGAIKLISDIKLWDSISNYMHVTPDNVKMQLDLIIDRRNKIAHEADADPTFAGQRWHIDETMVKDAIQFIENLVNVIYKVV